METDSGAAAQIAALEFEPDLQKKQFFEDEAAMCRRGARFQIGEAFSQLGKVNLLKRIAPRRKLHLFAYARRDAVGNVGREFLHYAMKHIAKPARIQLPDRFIDGNDPAYLDRLLQAFFDQAFRFVFVLSENFDLRLHDLESGFRELSPSFFYLAVQGQHLSGFEAIAKVGTVKPRAHDRLHSLTNDEFKNRDSAFGAVQVGITHFRNDGGELTNA